MALVSQRAYARHRGVSLKAVQKAVQSGRIHLTGDGKVDSDRADLEWDRNTTPKTKQTAAPPLETSRTEAAPGLGALDYARARAIRENYLARLAKIDYEERSAKLVSRDEVQIEAFNRFRTFRDGMLNIADRVAAMLAAESDPAKAHEILTAEIRKALLEFADGANG